MDGVDSGQVRKWTVQLYRDYEQICFTYRLKILRPSIQVKLMKDRWGCWDPVLRLISVSTYLLQRYEWDVVLEILKHEMAHQIADELLGGGTPHGESFQRACDRLAVSSWARRAAVDLDEPLELLRQPELSADEQRLHRKVQKLLALSESENEHEALAAMRKVRELCDRHRIDTATTLADDEFDVLTISHHKKRIPHYQVKIGSILGAHFGVRIVYNDLYDMTRCCSVKVVELLGSRSSLKIAEYVYWFLYNQLPKLWHEFRQNSPSSAYSARKRHSFYDGVLEGFATQLARNSWPQAEDVTAEQRALIRLADTKLEAFAVQRHPRLVSVSGRARGWDRRSYDAGHDQGRKLKLRRPLSRSNQSGSFSGYIE